MAKWTMTFQGNEKYGKAQFTPLTVTGPPYDHITINAETAEDAARTAKGMYPTLSSPETPMHVPEEEMDVILVTSFNEKAMTMTAATFDYQTLERKSAPWDAMQ